MANDNLDANVNDFDLEYKDVVSDPSNPEMKQLTSELAPQYKGKGLEDVIQMHVNAEKVIRRQGNELGQVRRLLDSQSQLINTLSDRAVNQAPRAPAEQPRRDPITAETLLTNPEQAIKQAVAPAVANQNTRINNLERDVARQSFEARNPDFMSDVQTPEFQEWVAGSQTRTNLLVRLNQYDFGAGNELWSLYNEHRDIQKQQAQQNRAAKVRAASTVKGSAIASPNENTSKPVYSRSKLAELQLRAMSGDPVAQERWNDPAFQAEYTLAYAEDRVK